MYLLACHVPRKDLKIFSFFTTLHLLRSITRLAHHLTEGNYQRLLALGKF
jgi:hypothetical protein